MRRREVIAGLIGSAAALPFRVVAQESIPVIGYLSGASREQDSGRLRAFREGLRDAGFLEGRNVAIEYRWANDERERLPTLAAELVVRRVAVIATTGQIAGALAAKAETSTIPIVFTTGSDPVELGLVRSLNQPGGNITGVTTLSVQLEPKRLEILYSAIPSARVMAALINPLRPNAGAQSSEMREAARALGLTLEILNASSERDFEVLFASLSQRNIRGLMISTDSLFISLGERLGALSLQYRIPAIFQFRAFASAGGLMSYGGSLADLLRLAGIYVGRILKGEKPGDLPVQQSTKAELFVNLRTAGALGIDLPMSLLARADEVIE
jgi:putative tryptophan/tyrosine transport system substrate-binding protein